MTAGTRSVLTGGTDNLRYVVCGHFPVVPPTHGRRALAHGTAQRHRLARNWNSLSHPVEAPEVDAAHACFPLCLRMGVF